MKNYLLFAIKLLIFVGIIIRTTNSYADFTILSSSDDLYSFEVTWGWNPENELDTSILSPSYPKGPFPEKDNHLDNWQTSLVATTNKNDTNEWHIKVTGLHLTNPHASDTAASMYEFEGDFTKTLKGLTVLTNDNKVDHLTKHNDTYSFDFYRGITPKDTKITITGKHPMLVTLDYFSLIPKENGVILIWTTATEKDNGGFRLWRVTDNGSGSINISTLEKISENELIALPIEKGLSKLIPTKNAGVEEKRTYSYIDTSINMNTNVTYYYLIEDYDMSSNTLNSHCGNITAIVINQGPSPDLDTAMEYCLAD